MALKAPLPEAKASDHGKVDPLREAMHWLLHWWQDAVQDIDHVAVIDKVHGESYLTGRYVFMTCMSAGIAILGLLLSSPAVVIGAMLLSPLMGPILGAGFAMAIGDVRWLRECSVALLVGIIVAILFCAAIVLISPLDTVTEEIAARTRPNLFDLGVALFSALAGSYAMIKGREGTIVGVAIATALMPPLAVVGFGLATGNGVILGGSLLLFFTNLMTIALTAAIMARLNGFRSVLSAQHTLMQSLAAIVVFVVLAVPLALSLQQVAWESNAIRRANSVVASAFGVKARVSQLDIDYVSEPIALNATVLTPQLEPKAAETVERLLTQELGVPISVAINQYRVGTDDQDVQNAELAAAKLQAQSVERDRRVASLVDTLALVADVDRDEVFVDQSKKKLVVKAKSLPGAKMASYYALEQRMAKREPEWQFVVEPPAIDLPTVLLSDGVFAENDEDYALALWAIERVDSPVAIVCSEDVSKALLERLRADGVNAVYRQSDSATQGSASFIWLAPNSTP